MSYQKVNGNGKIQGGETHNIVTPLLRILARKKPSAEAEGLKLSDVAGYKGRGWVLPAGRVHPRPDPA